MTAQERLLEWCERFSEEFDKTLDAAVRELTADKEIQQSVEASVDLDVHTLLCLIRAYRIEKLTAPIVKRAERKSA